MTDNNVPPSPVEVCPGCHHTKWLDEAGRCKHLIKVEPDEFYTQNICRHRCVFPPAPDVAERIVDGVRDWASQGSPESRQALASTLRDGVPPAPEQKPECSPLVVTRDGVPCPDQKAALREFMQAAIRKHPFIESERSPFYCDTCGGLASDIAHYNVAAPALAAQIDRATLAKMESDYDYYCRESTRQLVIAALQPAPSAEKDEPKPAAEPASPPEHSCLEHQTEMCEVCIKWQLDARAHPATAESTSPPQCRWCMKGDSPKLIDADGTLVSITGRAGTLCHAFGEYWWPCLRYGAELHTAASRPAGEQEGEYRRLRQEEQHFLNQQQAVERAVKRVLPQLEGIVMKSIYQTIPQEFPAAPPHDWAEKTAEEVLAELEVLPDVSIGLGTPECDCRNEAKAIITAALLEVFQEKEVT